VNIQALLGHTHEDGALDLGHIDYLSARIIDSEVTIGVSKRRSRRMCDCQKARLGEAGKVGEASNRMAIKGLIVGAVLRSCM
jgi:hypothetical protein